MRITRLPDGRWWCDGYVAGKRKRGTFISRALAEAYKAQCERQSFNRKHGIAEMSATQLAIAQELFRRLPPDVDVLKLVDDYLITHRVKNRIPLELGIEQFLDRLRTNNKRPQYIKSIGKPLRRLNRYFQSMVMICDITKDDILKFLDTSIVATPANGYHYLNDFAVFFNYCVREGHCAVSPIKNIQKPTLDYTEPWVLRLQQCQDLLSNTSGQVRAYSALALGCGIRPMELLRMDWSLVDLEGATVRVPAALSKTRTTRVIPLEKNIMAWLQTVQNGSGSIFTGDPNRLTEHMCSAVGVQRWKVDWLRHTYCRMHICAFMNPNLTAMHMHCKESPDIIYRHYFRRILVQDAKAFWQYYPNSSV